jgi:hypothetical protein
MPDYVGGSLKTHETAESEVRSTMEVRRTWTVSQIGAPHRRKSIGAHVWPEGLTRE